MTEELREAVGTSRAASRHISTTLTLGLGRNYVTPLYLYYTVGTSRAASRHISTTLTLGLGRNYVTPLYLYCIVYTVQSLSNTSDTQFRG
jgi:hypothetical protein